MEYKPKKEGESGKKKGFFSSLQEKVKRLKLPYFSLVVWIKRIKIMVLIILLVLVGAIAGWILTPQDLRTTMVNTFRGYIGMQVIEVDFKAQSIDDNIQCTDGEWKKYDSTVVIAQPPPYQDNLQYYEGDIVTYDIVSSTGIPNSLHHNCNGGQVPGTCEVYYCIPEDFVSGSIASPTQAIASQIGTCDVGQDIGETCSGQGSQGLYKGKCAGVCEVVFAQSNGQKFLPCRDMPYDDVCEGSTQSANSCVKRTISCNTGENDMYCGERHQLRYYEDEDIADVTPGLCRGDALMVPGTLNFMKPGGWTWKCVKGNVVSPSLQDVSMCYANVSYCGDDTVNSQYGEKCDDGEDNGPNGECSSACKVNAYVCGNGVVEPGEECDDGNKNNDDYCSNSCMFDGVNSCVSINIYIKSESRKINGITNIDRGRGHKLNNNQTGVYKIYDVGDIDTCIALKNEVAKVYCGGDDNTYFDSDGLLYDSGNCEINQADDAITLYMEGDITCCDGAVCDDDKNGNPPTPDTESCTYVYPGEEETGPGCSNGSRICSDNAYGVCIPDNAVFEELCNGLDDDCDGTIDEGAGTIRYKDLDGDGFGDGNTQQTACEDPGDDWVTDGTDCNDDPAYNGDQEFPGNPDVCADGIDQDCSGADSTTTCGDEPIIYCYKDADKDGYGFVSIRTEKTGGVCPEGFVENNTDCDDSDAGVHATILCDYNPDTETCTDVYLCRETCPDNSMCEENYCNDGGSQDDIPDEDGCDIIPGGCDIEEGLVGYWTFDDDTAVDDTGNGHDGELAGDTSFVDGKLGRGVYFDGNRDFIDISDHDNLDPEEITLVAWVNHEGQSKGQIMDKGGNTGYRYRVNGNNSIYVINKGTTNMIQSDAQTIPIDSWHHVVMQGNETGLKIYIDGVKVKENDIAYIQENTSTDLRLGGSFLGGGEYLKGALDDVRLYNRSLSDAEIIKLYNLGALSTISQMSSPVTTSCVYNYPGNLETGPGCDDGIRVCSDNTYGSCISRQEYEGGEEICNGLDDDCDGKIDEGLNCYINCDDTDNNGICDDEEEHGAGGPRTGGDNDANVCGDGDIGGSEECDDENTRSGDGCSRSCKIEDIDEEEDDDSGNTKEIFADYLSDALRKLEDACDYDDYNYQDIMFRDVEWDPDSQAINTLLSYCIVKGYDRSRNTKFYTDAATSKAEAIKILAKLDGMGYGIPFDETGFVRGTLPFKDMKPNAWYTTYVMYAHTKGLLDGLGTNNFLGLELKALTPILKSEMRTLLQNAGIDKEYRELEGFGQYVYRDDMANIMVDAFGDKLKDYQYLYGNNIKIYSMILQRLQDMSATEQLSYMKRLVSKFKQLDHRIMGENFNLHMRGMVEFLENILDEVTE